MADESKVGTPDDGSNVDQINKLITNSKKTESKVEDTKVVVEETANKEEPIAIEKPKAAEQPDTVKESKSEVEKKIAKKVEHKKPHQPQHQPHLAKPSQSVQMTYPKEAEIKKPEIKKEEKHEKVEHKLSNPVKNSVKHIIKQEEKVDIKREIKPAKSEHKQIVKPEKSEPKKIVKETPEVKKVISIKKLVKEEKMKNHKEHKEHKKKFKFNKNILMWIGIGVLVIILAVALMIILSPKKTVQPVTNQTSNSVAATVNGDPIYTQDVLREYDGLSPALKSTYTIESILNKSINVLLLYQEAKNRDITVKTEEVQSAIDVTKEKYNLTDTALDDALKQQGLTLDSWKVLIEKDLMIEKLLNATIQNNITVTERQIESYYNLNLDKFQVPEKVTVQHILILITPNVTNETAYSKIQQIQKELNDTNFCELVTKYSEDPGSLETCGKYTFAKGDFQNPEFENPSFDLKVGETTIVKTVFGYHLIKKLEAIPARTMNLSEVRNDIELVVHDQIAQKNFDALLSELVAKASIVNYMTKTDNNETTVVQVKSLDDFAKCITTKGVVFYGASWCTHCQAQKTLFGDSLQYVKYVECAASGNTQTKECTDAGISGYPTWIVNNQSYPGEQTLENLAKLTGCILPQ